MLAHTQFKIHLYNCVNSMNKDKWLLKAFLSSLKRVMMVKSN